jgi:MFS family permease
MLYPVLPIFLTQTLNAPASVVGIVEGVAIAVQYIVQGFSGWLSDKLQNRKSVALVGYTLAALSKPFLGLATIWQEVLAARFVDRLGTGIRSAPRDGLIAASADEKSRGKAFGLEGIGDNLGAFLGPLIAALLLFIFLIPIRWIFYLALIPGLLAVVMIAVVREKKVYSSSEVKRSREVQNNSSQLTSFAQTIKSNVILNASRFPLGYWKYLFVTAIFGIGNSSNAFLILRTKQIGIPFAITIIIYAFFNLVAALSSFPAGHLSDKFGRKIILLISFITFVVVYLGFALATNYILLTACFILYGMFSGAYRAVGKALATDFVKADLRASAVGWFSTTIGLSGLIASLVAGQLWTQINPQAAFLYSVLFAILGTIALFVFVPKNKEEK